MASFTTRVELHNASWADYEQLHAAMEEEGFSRQITNKSGTTYQLPTAEYNLIGEYTKNQVLAKAERAAATTSKLSSILVTASNGRTWSGLSEVDT